MDKEYGMWGLAVLMIVIFGVFSVSFLKPLRKREWRSIGVFHAFIVALYAEMYGFPLTIYILSTFFGKSIPMLHVKGHLWASAFNLGDTWAMVICQFGSLLMIAGILVVIHGWVKIYKGRHDLVRDGLYAYIRHPQYLGILLITSGMLIQWPTILTGAMWPVLLFAYWKLAKREETQMAEQFGKRYDEYKKGTGMFLPKWSMLARGRRYADD